jgi:hypothetical protein
MTLNNLHFIGAQKQPIIPAVREVEIAGECIEIHLELMEIWTQADSIENALFDHGGENLNQRDLSQNAIQLDGLSGRCVDQRQRFYSAIGKWFAEAGCPGNEREAIRLSHFGFGQRLYDFKTRCGVSPLVMDVIKGVRTEIETLHRNVIPNLVALIEEHRHNPVPVGATS